MAEAIGFILSIAGLYSSCVDAFDQIRAARSFGRDYEILGTRFDIRKTRFLQWGDGVGLLLDTQNGRHPHLDSPSLRPAVERVLHCIQMLLTDTESFKYKYGLQEMMEHELHDWKPVAGVIVSGHRRNLFRNSYARFQGQMKKHQKEKSLITKTKWAIVGRNEFRSLISDLDGMIEDLYKLIPVQPAFRGLMVKEDIGTLPEDLAALKLVQEACAADAHSDDQDTWLEAASMRVEATELGTQDRRRIDEWLDALPGANGALFAVAENAVDGRPAEESGRTTSSPAIAFDNSEIKSVLNVVQDPAQRTSHEKASQGYLTLRCNLCPSIFDGKCRRDHLRRHLKSVHGKQFLTCKLCGRSFTYRTDNLAKHFRVVHPGHIPPGSPRHRK